jgi:N,N'-diacetyllegionaminate synthase
MNIFGKNLDTDIVVIAEIGVNHEGDQKKAIELLRAAAKAGADAVKFQSYTPERYVAAIDQERLERVSRFMLHEQAHRDLAEEAASIGVSFLSTPVSEDWLPLLIELGAAVKIASGDLNFEPVIRGAAKSGKPIILSVGLGSLEEIDRAIEWVKSEIGDVQLANRLVLMHCVSAYPVPIEEANVLNIDFLRDRYGLTVGYSNHVIGSDAVLAAAARGARIFEIHFTDQKEGRIFRDHALSMDENDLSNLIPQLKRIASSLGELGNMRQPCERPNLASMRKGIIAARPIERGTVLSQDDIMFARPEVGFSCLDVDKVVGQKITESLAFGHPILPEHLG